MLPTNEVEDDESDDMDINYTTDVKMPQLSYKLNKASLMRKYKSYRSWALLFSMNTDNVLHTDVSFITVYSSMDMYYDVVFLLMILLYKLKPTKSICP